jgi:hypothetical protein
MSYAETTCVLGTAAVLVITVGVTCSSLHRIIGLAETKAGVMADLTSSYRMQD